MINSKKHRLTFCALLALVLSATGCSGRNQKIVKLDLRYITIDSVPIEAVNKNSESNIAQSSVSVSRSMRKLTALSQAVHPDLRVPGPLNAKQLKLSQRVSIDWMGPVEPVLTKLAHASHYKLNLIGHPPATPAVVSLHKDNVELAEIIQDIRYQVINKAQLIVYKHPAVIELRYFKY